MGLFNLIASLLTILIILLVLSPFVALVRVVYQVITYKSTLADLDLDILIESEFKKSIKPQERFYYTFGNSSTKKKMIDNFKNSNKALVNSLAEKVRGSVAVIASKQKDELKAVSKAAISPLSLTDSNGAKHVVSPIVSSIVKSSPGIVGQVVYDTKATASQVPDELKNQVIKELKNPLLSASISMAATIAANNELINKARANMVK